MLQGLRWESVPREESVGVQQHAYLTQILACHMICYWGSPEHLHTSLVAFIGWQLRAHRNLMEVVANTNDADQTSLWSGCAIASRNRILHFTSCLTGWQYWGLRPRGCGQDLRAEQDQKPSPSHANSLCTHQARSYNCAGCVKEKRKKKTPLIARTLLAASPWIIT